MSDTEGGTLDPVGQLLMGILERPETEWVAAVESACVEHPQWEAKIRNRFEVLQAAGLTPEPAETDTGHPERIGDYQILRRLGGGGMGLVYLARQASTQREVALKLIRPEFALDPRLRDRFRREIVAAASIEDPGICTVFDAGVFDGAPYLAMQYVEGMSLADYVDDCRGDEGGAEPISTKQRIEQVLEIVSQLARSLQVAHASGLVHRDIKPSNVILRGDGRPVLVDFGLARFLESSAATLTVTGELLGTPAYMAPEQIKEFAVADQFTDTYAMGVLLFEMLTLRRPFEATTRESLFAAILDGHPPSCRRLEPTVGKDLELVVHTAMDRDPRQRYESAAALAEDLERVRDGRPILARPLGQATRLRRWATRSPTAATALVFLSVGLGVVLWLLGRVSASLRTAQAVGLAKASAEARTARPELALRLALAAHDREPSESSRTQLYGALGAMHCVKVLPDPDSISSVFQVRGEKVLCAGDYGVSVRDADGNVLRRREGRALRASMSPDGRDVVVVPREQAPPELWRDGDEEPTLLDGHSGGFAKVARFCPGGRYLVSCRADKNAVLWDRSGRKVRDLTGHTARVTWAAFSPNGLRLATCSVDRTVRVWDLEQDVKPTVLGPYPTVLVGVRWVGNERILAMPASGLVPRLWLGGDRFVNLSGHRAAVEMDATRSGDLIVTASRDRTGRIWSSNGVLIAEMRGSEAPLFGVTISPDGRWIACRSGESAVRVWDRLGHSVALLRGHTARVDAGLGWVSADRLMSSSRDGTIRIWQLDAFTGRGLRGHSNTIRAMATSEDDRWIATAGMDHIVRLWSATGECVKSWPMGRANPTRLSFSPDNRVLMSCAGFGGGCTIYPVEEDADPIRLGLDPGYSYSARMSRAGSQIWTTSYSTVVEAYMVHRWERDADGDWTSTELESLRGVPAEQLVLSPDESKLALACRVQGARVIDLDGTVLHSFPMGSMDARDVAWSPDGGKLVTAWTDGSVRLHTLLSGETTLLSGHRTVVASVEFSPDGKLLATASRDGTARIWTLDGACQYVIPHDGGVLRARFFDGGRELLTAGANRVVRRWPTDPAELVQLGRLHVRPFTAVEESAFADLLDR